MPGQIAHQLEALRQQRRARVMPCTLVISPRWASAMIDNTEAQRHLHPAWSARMHSR